MSTNFNKISPKETREEWAHVCDVIQFRDAHARMRIREPLAPLKMSYLKAILFLEILGCMLADNIQRKENLPFRWLAHWKWATMAAKIRPVRVTRGDVARDIARFRNQFARGQKTIASHLNSGNFGCSCYEVKTGKNSKWSNEPRKYNIPYNPKRGQAIHSVRDKLTWQMYFRLSKANDNRRLVVTSCLCLFSFQQEKLGKTSTVKWAMIVLSFWRKSSQTSDDTKMVVLWWPHSSRLCRWDIVEKSSGVCQEFTSGIKMPASLGRVKKYN